MKISITQRRALFLAAGGAAVALVVYRRYHPELQARWQVWGAINDTLDSWRRLAGVSKAVLKDASEYIEGTTAQEELPQTLQRLGDLASSPQAVNAAAKIISRVLHNSHGPSFLDKVLEVAVTERGQELIGATTTKAVHAFFSAYQGTSRRSSSNENVSESRFSEVVDKTLAWAATPAGQPAAACIIAAFMASIAEKYLDRRATTRSDAEGLHTFEKFMETVSKPDHLKVAQKLVATFASASVNSVLKSSRKSASRAHPLSTGSAVLRSPLQEITHGRPSNQHITVAEDLGNSSFAPEGAATHSEGVDESIAAVGEHAESRLRTVISDVVVRAFQSKEVRVTCVAMARAGCSGAADVTWTHVKHATAQWQVPARMLRGMYTIILAWMLLLSLWFLHVLVLVPARDSQSCQQ